MPCPLNVALRKHYKARHNDKLRWYNYIQAETHGKRPQKPLTRALITITRYSSRTLDFDGLAGSLKPVVDALKISNIIIDDSWKVTGPWVLDQKFKPRAEGERLEIRVDECSI